MGMPAGPGWGGHPCPSGGNPSGRDARPTTPAPDRHTRATRSRPQAVVGRRRRISRNASAAAEPMPARASDDGSGTGAMLTELSSVPEIEIEYMSPAVSPARLRVAELVPEV